MPTVEQELGGVVFEWDSQKAQSVLKEHGVTLAECATVLLNETVITKNDFRDYKEQRFISTGYSEQARILTVVWTARSDKIRLITGFKATKSQVQEFYNGQ